MKLLQEVRDTIARSRTRWRFDMAVWLHTVNSHTRCVDTVGEFLRSKGHILKKSCGTVGCIAGWTVVVGAKQVEELNAKGALGLHDGIGEAASRLLEIEAGDAYYVFRGEWSEKAGGDLEDITKRETLDYLDECIAAGEVVRR